MNKSVFLRLLPVIFLFVYPLCGQSVQDENAGLNMLTRDYDQLAIALALKPDFKAGTISGQARFSFVPASSRFKVLRLHSKYTSVASVTDENGKDLEFETTGKLLKIFFQRDLTEGKPVTITIEYTATPGRGMYFFAPNAQHPELPYQLWSQGQSDYNRCWYPAYDLPDDKLVVSVSCTVPPGFTVISNGALRSQVTTPTGELTFSYGLDYPHSNYLTTLIAGNFIKYQESFKGIDLITYFPHDWRGTDEDVTGRTSSMMGFYSDYILPYPFPAYTQTYVQDFEYGGMENTSATTLNKRVLHDKLTEPQISADNLIAHELGHQWWGDIVTCAEWKDIWLNEGFATYFTPLWKLYAYGDDVYLRDIKGNQASVLDKENNIFFVNDTSSLPIELQGGLAYSKGAAVLHAIRERTGAETFRKVIRAYINEYAFKTVTTEDFLRILERETSQSYRTLFTQFVYGSGYPEFELSTIGNIKEGIFALVVKQLQKGSIFSGEIPLLVGSTEKHIVNLKITDRIDTFSFSEKFPVYYLRFNNRNIYPLKYTYKRNIEQLLNQFYDVNDFSAKTEVIDAIAMDSTIDLGVLDHLYTLTNDPELKGYILDCAARKMASGSPVFTRALYASEPELRQKAVRYLTNLAPKKMKSLTFDFLASEKNVIVQAELYRAVAITYTNDDSLLLLNGLGKVSHQNIIRREIFNGLRETKNGRFLNVAQELLEYRNSFGDNHALDFSILDYAAEMYPIQTNTATDIFLKGLNNYYFRTRVASAGNLIKYCGERGKEEVRKILETEHREIVRKPLEKYLGIQNTGSEED